MPSTVKIVSFVLLGMQFGTGKITLPRYYHDGMVMQADQNQTMIWGFTTSNNEPVVATVSCSFQAQTSTHKMELSTEPKHFKQSMAQGFVWEIIYPETRSNGDICTIEIGHEDSLLTLKDIIFGDVWLCSGQSNMVFPMGFIFNSSDEIAHSASYSNIRMYQANVASSLNEEEDLIGGGWGGWYTPDETSKLRSFSAVCFLFARYLSDLLDGEKKKVFGLIQSAVDGTIIEAWSSQDVLDACSVPPARANSTSHFHPELNPFMYDSNAYLWNAIIHPFLRHNIFGILWYQGEQNGDWNNELYSCTFPTMIRDWRSKWYGSDPGFPFGFVQLANRVGRGGALIRWHQTVDHGYVPNPDLDNVFMAVAMDTLDPVIFPYVPYVGNGYHSRYKHVVGKRLAISGANVAYGMGTPTNGPFPNLVIVKDNSTVEVTYDQIFTYNNDETSGFWYCCYEFDECNYPWRWIEFTRESVASLLDHRKILVDFGSAKCESRRIQSIAYLWEDNAVKTYQGAPIYASDDYELPGAPWAFPILYR